MESGSLIADLEQLWISLQNSLIGLAQPWRLYQIGMLVVGFLVAHFADLRFEPRMDAWMRGLENVPRSRLRLLVLLNRHLRSLIFIALAWSAVFAIRATTWPSRSYLIALVASLVTAWVFVSIASRFIRNRLLRTIATWSAWAIVTVHILGMMTQATDLLDQIAIRFGDVNLSLLLVVKAAITLAILLAVAGWASGAVKNRVEAVEDMSPSMKVLTDKLFRLVVYGVAIVIGLQSIGFDLTSLTLFSGAIGLGIGFGLQKVVSNLISGVILLIDKSIKPGDVISLGETFGWISELGARYVSVVTRDGREYLIPNEDLITGQVVNWSHSSELVRLDIYFGVSYDSDPHEIRKLASEAAAGVKRVVGNPAPVCHVVGFGDSSIDFILRFWISDPTGGLTNVRGAVFLALWDALKAADIEIPFPRRDVTILSEVRGAEPKGA
ncbi:MAG TPA: mechanosensitive ion channel domain-containing protein [Thermohalobaculum sp.]|nr:mechanosensitive ion channel domain-containing protein [Thermohalobaculum sp.]